MAKKIVKFCNVDSDEENFDDSDDSHEKIQMKKIPTKKIQMKKQSTWPAFITKFMRFLFLSLFKKYIFRKDIRDFQAWGSISRNVRNIY